MDHQTADLFIDDMCLFLGQVMYQYHDKWRVQPELIMKAVYTEASDIFDHMEGHDAIYFALVRELTLSEPRYQIESADPWLILGLIINEIHKLGLPEPVQDGLRALMALVSSTTTAMVNIVRLALGFLRAAGVDVLIKLVADYLNAVAYNMGFAPRTRAKSVWPPVFKHSKPRLTKLEQLAQSAHHVKFVERDFESAISNTIKVLNACFDGPEQEKFPEDLREFVRRMRFPRTHRGTHGEWEGVDVPGVTLLSTPELEKRVAQLLKFGATQGIDASYLSDDERRFESFSRYLSEQIGNEPKHKEMARDAAEVLKEIYPEAFPKPRLATPEMVQAYEVKKYSPGIPGLSKFRDRESFYAAGWGKAIVDGVKLCIEKGEYPTMLHHLFPKSQVVEKDKVMAGKPPRTVIAQDKLSSTLDGVGRHELVKVVCWDTSDISLGAPMTEPYFRMVFNKINAYLSTMEGDITAADANLPGFVFEGLAHLCDIVAGSDAEGRAVNAISQAHYDNLKDSWIIDLEDGTFHHKTRGGGTGQSSTSWDNTWGVKIFFMVLWAEVTGLPVQDFFLHNAFVNTGDDNLWGNNDPNFDPDKASKLAHELWGISLKLAKKPITELNYLSNRIVPTTEEDRSTYESRSLGLPDLKIIKELPDILMRRSAFKARESGFGPLRFTEYCLERTAGHILLTGHQPMVYDLMAREYAQDLRHLFRRSYIEPVLTLDKDGLVCEVTVSYGGGDPAIKKLLKERALPTYNRVLDLHLKALPDGPAKRHASAQWNRYSRAMPPAPLAVVKLYNMLRGATDVSPYTAMHRLGPTPEFAPLTLRAPSTQWTIERYIWLCGELRNSPGTFSYDCRSSPYSSATDAIGFTALMRMPSFRAKFIGESDEEKVATLNRLRTKLICMTMIYYFIHAFIAWARGISALWWLAEMFLLWIIDRPRLYALLNLALWHLIGESSVVLSSLIPKDAYGPIKKTSRMLVDVIPDAYFPELPTMGMELWFKARFEDISRAIWAVDTTLTSAKHGLTFSNEWDHVVTACAKLITETSKPVLLVSGTSSGKSSRFMVAIYNDMRRRGQIGKIWMCFPTIALREQADIGGSFPKEQIISAKSRVEITSDHVIVKCTYGHFLARLDAGALAPWDVVVVDEGHTNLPELAELYTRRLKQLKYILTATPSTMRYFKDSSVFDTGFKRRFPLEEIQMQSKTVEDTILEALALKPDLLSSLLIIVPATQEAVRLTTSINNIEGAQAKIWVSGMEEPDSQVIVATQVAEVGIDLKVPKKYMIDSGRTIRSDRGVLNLNFPEDRATWAQRAGRVGRSMPGFAFRCGQPLTDTAAVPYPAAYDLLLSKNRKELITLFEVSGEPVEWSIAPFAQMPWLVPTSWLMAQERPTFPRPHILLCMVVQQVAASYDDAMDLIRWLDLPELAPDTKSHQLTRITSTTGIDRPLIARNQRELVEQLLCQPLCRVTCDAGAVDCFGVKLEGKKFTQRLTYS